MLENEATCNVGTGKEPGRIVRHANSPHLRGNWDPSNAGVLGEAPYPNGYQDVLGLFVHMHVKDRKKDAQRGELRWVTLGSGFIGFKSQFRALRQDGHNETISLETHYRRAARNALESSREPLEGLLKILNEIA